ncbi:hypothetical protein OF117_15370 [Geodermatophilus sp. YIM 151500]|uniref:hypothetical protein n=1 Tax=Geodermatophilus sp. YIM 151500 TaxID=2984531 RepID=UPI0021E4679B|nr:hypothetical protein [Geodermatophilus sp. YIM 151500]MCV2490739.1 hypothetical protein [Geodermatophilus sp. YIM 151500]
MHPPAPPAPPSGTTAPPLLPRPTAVAIVVLTAATTVVGLLDWPRPAGASRTVATAVAAAPAALWVPVLACTAACLATAVLLLRRTADLRLREPRAWALLGVLALAAAGSVGYAVHAAALSATLVGPVIPVLDWLLTVVPPLLTLPITVGRRAGTRVAVGALTGVVTLPLLALGWSLLLSGPSEPGSPLDAVWNTAVLGAVPFLLVLLLIRTRCGR